MEAKEIFLMIAAFCILVYMCTRAMAQRRQVTRQCPKCGATCNASPFSTGVRTARGEIYKFKCPNCGHKFLS